MEIVEIVEFFTTHTHTTKDKYVRQSNAYDMSSHEIAL